MLVTDKFEMTIVLLTKCVFKPNDRRLNMISLKNITSHSSFKVAFIHSALGDGAFTSRPDFSWRTVIIYTDLFE